MVVAGGLGEGVVWCVLRLQLEQRNLCENDRAMQARFLPIFLPRCIRTS